MHKFWMIPLSLLSLYPLATQAACRAASCGGITWGMNADVENPNAPGTPAQAVSTTAAIGAKYLRVTTAWSAPDQGNVTLTANLVSLGASSGVQILPLLIDDPSLYTSESSAYSAAYAIGHAFAAGLPSVPVFELGNEMDYYSLISGANGRNTTDFDTTKYTVTRGVVRGLHDGVMAGNPNAKTIVDFAEPDSGFIQRLINDGVAFDYAGLHIYQNQASQVDPFLQTAAAWGKPIWMTEFGPVGLTDTQAAPFITAQIAYLASRAVQYNIQTAFYYNLYPDSPYEGILSTVGAQLPEYAALVQAIASCQ